MSVVTKHGLTGNIGVGVSKDNAQTFILIDEDGVELPAVFVDEEVVLTATTNDIRLGSVAVTSNGVEVGKKYIPSYNTTEGFKLVPSGSIFRLFIKDYDYTKLQAIFCSFNTTLDNSVYSEKVSIDGGVYSVQSTKKESEVQINDSEESIDFGFSNTTGEIRLIRYFTYKEIY